MAHKMYGMKRKAKGMPMKAVEGLGMSTKSSSKSFKRMKGGKASLV